MRNEYNRILAKLAQAREDGNSRRTKLWLVKLHKWQIAYGANQPVNMRLKERVSND